MIMFDGTAWIGNLPLAKSLRQRPDLTLGYPDPDLEQKRLESIAWLRMHGLWIVDRVVRMKHDTNSFTVEPSE